MPAKEDLLKGFTLGDWEVFPGRGVLCRGSQEERPEPKVFAVLLALAVRDGELVTRDDLVNEVWDGRPTSDEPINRCLSQLRGHLDDRARPYQYVETLQRRGYRLMKPVELQQRSEPTESPPVSGARLQLWRMVAVVMALGFLASILLTWRPWGADAEIRSIAVLPIENLSGDPANEYIVDGIRNVLARQLSEIPELSIKTTRVSYDEEPSRIARLLDVDAVVSGAVQLQDSTLKVTYLVSRGSDSVTIGSGEVNGNIAAIFALQEELANAVREDLTDSGTTAAARPYAPNAEAYSRYIRGIYALDHRGEDDNLETAIQLFQESIRLDENFGPSYLSLATAYALLHYYRGLPVEETNQAAIQAVEKGVSVDASIAMAAEAIYGSSFHQQKKWAESEAAYLRAASAPLENPIVFNWYSRMLNSVGRLDDALEQALKAVSIDPANGVFNSRVAIVYTWLGNSQKAHEYFERANRLGGRSLIHMLAFALLLIEDGRLEEAEAVANRGVLAGSGNNEWVRPLFAAFSEPSLTEAALTALQRVYARKEVSPEVVVTGRVMLGDIDGAMAVARKLEEPGEWFQMDLLFAPQLQPLRDHPEFLPLLERLGVVRYWQAAGCTFDGRKATCARD
ncbi:MAG: winged helix-turn-helix domain-containing protein [Woeseiaceae bacterium]